MQTKYLTSKRVLLRMIDYLFFQKARKKLRAYLTDECLNFSQKEGKCSRPIKEAAAKFVKIKHTVKFLYIEDGSFLSVEQIWTINKLNICHPQNYDVDR